MHITLYYVKNEATSFHQNSCVLSEGKVETHVSILKSMHTRYHYSLLFNEQLKQKAHHDPSHY